MVVRPAGLVAVDLFAGGGGASEGIRQAAGRGPLVAVNHCAVVVDHDQTITIAVQSNTEICTFCQHRLLQRFWRGRSKPLVDIKPVRLIAKADHIGAQLCHHGRRDVVGRTVGTIDNDFQTIEIDVV